MAFVSKLISHLLPASVAVSLLTKLRSTAGCTSQAGPLTVAPQSTY